MFTTSRKQPPLTKEEQAALDAEVQKGFAESQLLEASNAKKKLEADVEKLNIDIQNGKDLIEQNTEEVNKINESIISLQNKKRIAEKEFDDFVKEMSDKKSVTLSDIKKSEDEKQAIVSQIASKNKEHDSIKFEREQQIKLLVNTKQSVIEETAVLLEKKQGMLNEIETISVKIESATARSKKATEEKEALESLIASLKIEVDNQRAIIQNTKTLVDQIEKKKIENEADIFSLDESIAKKKEEYKILESKAFSLASKQQILDQKEAFLKNQYDRAGIKWED